MITADKLNEAGEASKSIAPRNSANTNGSKRSVGRYAHSKQELAFAYGVSPRTVDNWTAQKRIPFLKLSARLIRFDLERVKAALARYEVKEVGARR